MARVADQLERFGIEILRVLRGIGRAEMCIGHIRPAERVAEEEQGLIESLGKSEEVAFLQVALRDFEHAPGDISGLDTARGCRVEPPDHGVVQLFTVRPGERSKIPVV
jgi:hypothetical protein